MLESELKTGDGLSRYLLRSPEFGIFMAKSQGISAEKWYSLVGQNVGVLEDKLRNAAFSLAGIPRVEAALQRAKVHHEATLETMHNEIKAAIKAATDKGRMSGNSLDSKPLTVGDIRRMNASRGGGGFFNRHL